MVLSRSLARSLAAAGAAVLVSTVLVGCGGTDTLTTKEFQTRANKLCADANKDTESYGADISEKSTDSEVTAAIAKTVKRNNELVDAVDALKPPSKIAEDVDAMLKNVRAGNKELGKITSVADLMSFDPNGGVFKKANDQATKLGLDTCAS